MSDQDRDQVLLASLSRGLRAECEALVDRFIAAEMVAITPEALQQAADRYEEAGRLQPSMDGHTGFLFAAILRQRATVIIPPPSGFR